MLWIIFKILSIKEIRYEMNWKYKDVSTGLTYSDEYV